MCLKKSQNMKKQFNLNFLLWIFFLLIINLTSKISFADALDNYTKNVSTPQDKFIAIRLLYEAGRTAAADRLFESSKINNSKDPDFIFEAVLLTLEFKKNTKTAQSLCKKLDKLKEPFMADSCNALILLHKKNIKKADKKASQALKNKKNSYMLIAAAMIKSAMGDHKQATLLYKKALNSNSSHPVLLKTALSVEKSGHIKEAVNLLYRSVKDNPLSTLSNYNAGRLEPDKKKAAFFLKETLKINPLFSKATTLLGESLLNNKKFKEAEKLFIKASIKDNQNIDFYLGAAKAAAGLNNFADAMQFINKAKEFNYNGIQLLVTRIYVEIARGNTMEASILADDIKINNINKPETLFNIAQMFFQLERYTKADEAIEKFLTIWPDSSQAFLLLGKISCKRKLFTEGLNFFKKAASGNMINTTQAEIKYNADRCH